MSKPLAALVLSSLTFCSSAFSTDIRSATNSTPDLALVFGGEELLCRHALGGEALMRTELVFGLSRAAGPDITEAEFRGFIDGEVTRRFPEGLTLLSGNGQFKDATGTIVKENSKLLVLLYPFNKQRNALIEEIRSQYKTLFQQESVLRVDERSCVSF